MTRSHSHLAPSKAHRWLNCPGSVALEAAVPDGPASSYALEGTAAHLLCELRLTGMLSAPQLTRLVGEPMSSIDVEGVLEEINDIEITEEMVNAVQQYEIFIRANLPEGVSALNREYVRLEERVKTPFDDVEGTADCIIVDPFECLHVVDFKYGAGIQVYPEDNPQLAIYGMGAIEKFGDDFETIKLSIVQPRGSGESVRTWSGSIDKFIKIWTRKLAKGCKEVIEKPKLYRPGDWCKWCKGASKCGRVKRETTKLAKAASAPLPREAKALSKILQMETAVLEYINQAKTAAFDLLHSGVEVPGFKLVKTFGRTTWSDEVEAVERLPRVKGIWNDPKLKTPAQVRKVLGVKQLPEDLEALTYTPERGVKLVPETDRRPAYELPTIGNADEDGV